MVANQPVLDIAFVSNDAVCDQDLPRILHLFANRIAPSAPSTALEEWRRGSCEHALIVVDGYALGKEALALCRRLRLAGVTQPIILSWVHASDLDRAVCREFGATAVVSRPFTQERVAAAIRAAMTDSHSRLGTRVTRTPEATDRPIPLATPTQDRVRAQRAVEHATQA